jgi:hypothetical protein
MLHELRPGVGGDASLGIIVRQLLSLERLDADLDQSEALWQRLWPSQPVLLV